ncbi:RNA polymerase sigma factor [Colwellia sp. 12G3]|uniref:RNA polymerase sigma factor n=1 Tax=Colwellia sp. 12G3 TaxID=2058299 RepID=UPI000C3295D8|nr:sigma-70 family RNA polymerase sigma factor [Colwellia sp. 12G3]PKI16637.1 RNA polymerase subunit sigma [Colwellia sp. 12G3]
MHLTKCEKSQLHKEFDSVIENNQGRIRHIVSRYCTPEEFEDMYQEILLQLWRSFDSFKNHSSRETWLYKVALNTACTFVSKNIKNRALDDTLSNLNIQDEQQGQESCQADILTNFMKTLGDIDANVLMMYLDGITSEGMAEVIGIKASAVRARLKRIKQSYQQQYIGE